MDRRGGKLQRRVLCKKESPVQKWQDECSQNDRLWRMALE